MQIEGKKFVFLGDSITEGHGVSHPDKIYLNLLKERFHLKKATNYGISATRIARRLEPVDWIKCDGEMCNRCREMDKDADICVFFGGTNDYGHGDAPLGHFEDRRDNTFYGACHLLFSYLIETYPTVVIMTPLHCRNDRNQKLNYKQPANLKTFVDIIKEVAQYYAIPVLDLYATSGIQPDVESNRVRLCPDGLHPNDEGQARIADRLAGFLQAL